MWTEIFSWIFTIVIVATGAVIGILKLVVPHFATKVVDNHFAKKIEGYKGALALSLEDHKHELNRITQVEAHNYQRLIRDFDLYTTKRHEIYPELYKQIRTAEWAIFSLANESVLDIDAYLETKSARQRQEIHDGLEDHYDDFVEKIKRDIFKTDKKIAQKRLEEAVEYLLVSEIYMSDEVSTIAHRVCYRLQKFLNRMRSVVVHTDAFHLGTLEDLKSEINDVIGELRSSARAELAVGYYTNLDSHNEIHDD